jgi:hypothetical protein
MLMLTLLFGVSLAAYCETLKEALDIGDTDIIVINDPLRPWTVSSTAFHAGGSGAQSAAIRHEDGPSILTLVAPTHGVLTYWEKSISGNSSGDPYGGTFNDSPNENIFTSFSSTQLPAYHFDIPSGWEFLPDQLAVSLTVTGEDFQPEFSLVNESSNGQAIREVAIRLDVSKPLPLGTRVQGVEIVEVSSGVSATVEINADSEFLFRLDGFKVGATLRFSAEFLQVDELTGLQVPGDYRPSVLSSWFELVSDEGRVEHSINPSTIASGLVYSRNGTLSTWVRRTVGMGPGRSIKWKFDGNDGTFGEEYRVSAGWIDDLYWRPYASGIPFNDALETNGWVWETGGEGGWTGDNSESPEFVPNEEIDSAVSTRGASWLQTQVTGPGRVAFWWDGDPDLSLRIDGEHVAGFERGGLSGRTSNWKREEFQLSSGEHVLRWETEQSRGRLDRVEFTPARRDIPLDIALDIPGVKIRHSGEWFGQTIETSDDQDAAQVTGLAPGKSAWLEITVPTPGALEYDWRLESDDPDDELKHVSVFFRQLIDIGTKARNGTWRSGPTDFTDDDFGNVIHRWVFTRGSKADATSSGFLDRILYRKEDGTLLGNPSKEGEPGPAGGGFGIFGIPLEEGLDIDDLVVRTGGDQPWRGVGGRAIGGSDFARPSDLKPLFPFAREEPVNSWLEIETSGPGVLFYWLGYQNFQGPHIADRLRSLPTIRPTITANDQVISRFLQETGTKYELFWVNLTEMGQNRVRWDIEERERTLNFEFAVIYLDNVSFVPAGKAPSLAAAIGDVSLIWRTSKGPTWVPAPTMARDHLRAYPLYGRDEEFDLYAAVSTVSQPGDVSWLETTVLGPAKLDFSVTWDHSEVRFLVDGKVVETYRSSTGGLRSGVSRFLPKGSHVLRWENEIVEGVPDGFQGTSHSAGLDRLKVTPFPDVNAILGADGLDFSSAGKAIWTDGIDSETGRSIMVSGIPENRSDSSRLESSISGPGLLEFNWLVPNPGDLRFDADLAFEAGGRVQTDSDEWRAVELGLVENPGDYNFGFGNPQEILPRYRGRGAWVSERVIFNEGDFPISWISENNSEGSRGMISSASFTPGIPLIIDDSLGFVTRSPDQKTFTSGETVTVTAENHPDSVFLYWSRDIRSTANPLQVKMDKPLVIRANYGNRISTEGVVSSGLVLAAVDADTAWSVQGDEFYDEGMALKIESSEEFLSDSLTSVVEGPVVVQFAVKVRQNSMSSLQGGRLEVLVGDSVVQSIRSTQSEWETFQFRLGEGTHPVRWRFVGRDATVWLDSIEFLTGHELPLPGPQLEDSRPIVLRAGDPFDFLVEVTGAPELFEVLSLPVGVQLDALTGRLFGQIDQPGSYQVKMLASASDESLPIVIDLILVDEGGVPDLELSEAGDGLRVRFASEAGFHYQLFSSFDLLEWLPFGDPITQTGEILEVEFPVIRDESHRFFRLGLASLKSFAKAREVRNGDSERWLAMASNLEQGVVVKKSVTDSGMEQLNELFYQFRQREFLTIGVDSQGRVSRLVSNLIRIELVYEPNGRIQFELFDRGRRIVSGELPTGLFNPFSSIPIHESESLATRRKISDLKAYFVSSTLVPWSDLIKTLVVASLKVELDDPALLRTWEIRLRQLCQQMMSLMIYVEQFGEMEETEVVILEEDEVTEDESLPETVVEREVIKELSERILPESPEQRVTVSVNLLLPSLEVLVNGEVSGSSEDRFQLVDVDGLLIELFSSKGHQEIVHGENHHVFEDLALEKDDSIIVRASYLGGAGTRIPFIQKDVRFQWINDGDSELHFDLMLFRPDAMRDFLAERHWATDKPGWFKPWLGRDYSLCPSRNSSRDPLLWSVGNHPFARKEYNVILEGNALYLTMDWYNSKCVLINELRWRIDSLGFNGVTDESLGELLLTDMRTGRALTWKGWLSGTQSGSQPLPLLFTP